MGIFDSIFGKKPKPAPRIIKPEPKAESDTGNIDDELGDLNLGEAPADGKTEFDIEDDDDDEDGEEEKPKAKPKK